MWRSYVNAVRARAPQALIVFDKFHIVEPSGKGGRRGTQRGDPGERPGPQDLVKNSRYLWLKNPWNLTGGQAERLATLVKLNTEVHRAYLLKEMFRRFWGVQASRLGQALLKLLVRLGRGHRSLAAAEVRPHDAPPTWTTFSTTSALASPTVPWEGMNNKAKVVMRRAYGLRTADSCATSLYHCMAGLQMPELSHRFA